jgi:hypothetical protein
VKNDPAVELWGTGLPKREFLHVYDPAGDVGSGQEASMAELARLAAEVVGYHGQFVCNTSMPDGTPQAARCYPDDRAGAAAETFSSRSMKNTYSCYVKQLHSTPRNPSQQPHAAAMRVREEIQMPITWGEFKRLVEASGVTEEQEISTYETAEITVTRISKHMFSIWIDSKETFIAPPKRNTES